MHAPVSVDLKIRGAKNLRAAGAGVHTDQRGGRGCAHDNVLGRINILVAEDKPDDVFLVREALNSEQSRLAAAQAPSVLSEMS